MQTMVKRAAAGAVLGGSLLVTGGLGIASAAPPVQFQDGLVNVAVGNVTILRDANVGVAASVAAGICGINVSDVNVLAEQTDQSSGPRTVCNVPGGDVVLSQNAESPGNSANAPGQATAPGQNR